MTKKEIIEKVKECYDNFTENEVDEKIIEILDANCHKLTAMAKTLDEDLRPVFTLVNCECPYSKDGNCSACENMVATHVESGELFSFTVVDLYCLKV